MTFTTPTTYSAAEVAERSGLTYRTLMRLREQGVLRPLGPRGRRSLTLWTDADLADARCVAALQAAGVSAVDVLAAHLVRWRERGRPARWCIDVTVPDQDADLETVPHEVSPAGG